MHKLFVVVFILFSFSAFSQKVQIVNGNYVAVKSSVLAKDSVTGKTFTDSKGNVFPVYRGGKGSMYVWVISKKGNRYRKYLKIS